MGNLKVAGLDIGSHNLTIDEPSGTLLVDGKEVSGSGGGGISYVWADEIARTATTGMALDEQGVQQDTNTVYKYNGTEWVDYYVMSNSTVQKYYEGTSAPTNSKSGDEWFDYNDGTLYKRVSDGTDSVWMAVNNSIGGGDILQYDIGLNEFILPYTRNGKRVYGIEVDCGALPNATYKTVDIPNYNASYTYWLSSDSYAFRSSDNTRLPLPYVASNTGVDYNVGASTVGNIILLLTSSNLSSVNISKVVLHYTKE